MKSCVFYHAVLNCSCMMFIYMICTDTHMIQCTSFTFRDEEGVDKDRPSLDLSREDFIRRRQGVQSHMVTRAHQEQH